MGFFKKKTPKTPLDEARELQALKKKRMEVEARAFRQDLLRKERERITQARSTIRRNDNLGRIAKSTKSVGKSLGKGIRTFSDSLGQFASERRGLDAFDVSGPSAFDVTGGSMMEQRKKPTRRKGTRRKGRTITIKL